MALYLGLLAPDLTHQHGWAHYSVSLIAALRRAGVRLSVIAARNSPPDAAIPRLLPGVDPLERGMLLKSARALPAARAALASCDLIHALIEPYAPLAALVAGRRPLVITGHGSYVRAAALRRFPVNRLYAWAFRRALLVCVSRYTAHAAEAVVPGVRAVVVNNGVDAARFASLQPLAPSDARPPVILSVGAVKARKGTLHLVRAMARVRERFPAARCVIIGSLDLEPAYAAQVRAAAAPLGDAVRLLGRVDDAALQAAYAQASIFALPSINVDWKFEGFGLTLLEASAAGLPVVSTRGSGTEDAVEHGVTGLLVPQENVEDALADALIALLSDPARARRMGDAGRAHAQRQTWDRVAAHMLALYEAELRRVQS